MIRPSVEMRFQAMQAFQHPLESFGGEAVSADVRRLLLGSSMYALYRPHAKAGHAELEETGVVLAQSIGSALAKHDVLMAMHTDEWELKGSFDSTVNYRTSRQPSFTVATVLDGRCRVSLTQATAVLDEGYADDTATFRSHQQVMNENWRMTRMDPNIASSQLHQADMGPGSSLLFVSSRGDRTSPQGMWHSFVPLSPDVRVMGHTMSTLYAEARKTGE
ncbi:MAG TPA: hypothetical protein VFI74_00320 [Candidatus Saccharimonadales bacterium]|nr:hypothetical protein [Candidatus Saccharimonadales bacterium]